MDTKYTVAEIGPKIVAFLKPVISGAGFSLTFHVEPGQHRHPDIEDPEIIVKFSGPDVELLLANRAELLLAFELLSMDALRLPPEDHSLLRFDANDYRALRIEELRLTAITAAENVKRTGRPFHFNPMSSRERRVIHISLRNEPEVRSESTGSGPIRQVVIVPAGMEGVPEPVRPPPPPREDPRGDSRGDRRGNFRGGPGGRRPGPRDRRS